jgi:hypothetical protein
MWRLRTRHVQPDENIDRKATKEVSHALELTFPSFDKKPVSTATPTTSEQGRGPSGFSKELTEIGAVGSSCPLQRFPQNRGAPLDIVPRGGGKTSEPGATISNSDRFSLPFAVGLSGPMCLPIVLDIIFPRHKRRNKRLCVIPNPSHTTFSH